MPKKLSSASLLAGLREVARDPARLDGEEGRAALAAALKSADAKVVREAAEIVREHSIDGLDALLVAAWRDLAGERAHADPGCLAKEAVLAALDAREHPNAELFARAAVYVQLEKARGGMQDTGGRVRGRGVLGLARLGHPDALVLFGACLADHDAIVRRAASRAVAHRGERDGAGLLLLKLGVGDEEPEVVVDCLCALFALAPEFAVPRATAMLRGRDRRARENALLALGTAAAAEAIGVLRQALDDAVLPEEREEIVEALGLSPRPEARAVLLEVVGGDRRTDARAALQALAIHRYDARLVSAVRAAVGEDAELARRVEELFG